MIHHCEEFDLSEIIFNRIKSICIPIITNQYILCKKLKAYKLCESLLMSEINNESLKDYDYFLDNRQKNNHKMMMAESKMRVYIFIFILF